MSDRQYSPEQMQELQRQLRGLSHDFGATFMMLESSFRRVKGLIDAGRQSECLEDQVRQLDACVRQSRRHMDDLVRLSTSGQLDMVPEQIDVQELVEELLLEHSELFQQRGIRVDVANGLPTMWCNRGRLKDVLMNLLRNAARHGCDRRDPRIVIERINVDDATLCGVRIWDNGPGIPAESAHEIFLPGRQLAETGGGSGWGLALARRTVAQFDGTLELESDCKEGTALRLVLPRAVERPERTERPICEPGREWKIQLDREHRARHAHHSRSRHQSPVEG